ncbi:hypothetical protein KC851_03350 [Candidatus Kaiserbacteria bacterium]|nr:hypothetical protein [Candidatus Kaiserbacteria bacterium]
MYVVFYGNDRKRVRDAADSYIDKNFPTDGTLTTIEGAEYELGMLNDALGATSLFGGVEWFVVDTPAANKDCVEEVKEALAAMAESPNTFIILEESLLAAAKKTYTQHATEITEFKTDKTDYFNAFSLAEALAQKDKRKLWVLLQEAKLSGMREEEIIGIIWWQLKSLRLAANTKTAKEAGMKDFPYNKAKRALSKFSNERIEELSQSLLTLYHDGHAGVRYLDIALERWVLKV